jgi:protocatechuate 3,4-dioxygenase beta subunit
MGSQPLVRNETFLRGGYFTNEEGIVEITSIYTGYYQGRCPHIHTMVHINWEEASNGWVTDLLPCEVFQEMANQRKHIALSSLTLER